MKAFYYKIKRYIWIVLLLFCAGAISQSSMITAYAYTEEEKEAAKAWLSANGYSPDAGGAAAAYADYMNGKFGAIPGLPEPNVKPQESQPPAEEPGGETPPPDSEVEKPQEEEPDKEKPENDKPETGNEGGESTTQPPADGTPEADADDTSSKEDTQKAAEELEQLVQDANLPDELPELVLPTPSQQEFSDMIDVFLSSFSEDEQDEINKAKERLERQKQERAAAEKEAEGVVPKQHRPQKNVILTLGAILFVAVIGLVIIIIKKNRE